MNPLKEPAYRIDWEDSALEEVAIDPEKLVKLLSQFAKVIRGLDKMGLSVYVASSSICLIHESRPPHKDSSSPKPDYDSVVAEMYSEQNWDGGDW